jgi:uncharacterized protein
MKLNELIKEKRQQILRLLEKHGARNPRVFGSVARDQTHVDSDIDFLVDFESNRGLINHAQLLSALSKLLEVPVDVVTENGLKPAIKQRILGEARPL